MDMDKQFRCKVCGLAPGEESTSTCLMSSDVCRQERHGLSVGVAVTRLDDGHPWCPVKDQPPYFPIGELRVVTGDINRDTFIAEEYGDGHHATVCLGMRHLPVDKINVWYSNKILVDGIKSLPWWRRLLNKF